MSSCGYSQIRLDLAEYALCAAGHIREARNDREAIFDLAHLLHNVKWIAKGMAEQDHRVVRSLCQHELTALREQQHFTNADPRYEKLGEQGRAVFEAVHQVAFDACWAANAVRSA